MILCDASLRALLPKLIRAPNYGLINPASIDIRIGTKLLVEEAHERWLPIDLLNCGQYILRPNQFVLVETFEYITVPNGYAVELKLKSSMARRGFNHSLAFWVDPGWSGILTMEVQNVTEYQHLKLECGMRFAQIIVHRLDQDAHNPYSGRYQHAGGVEAGKL